MNKGFTLIELLVVVLIIGILAAIALPQYTKAVERARFAEAMQTLGDLATAESIYYMENGEFTGLAELSKGDVTIAPSSNNFDFSASVGTSSVTLTAGRKGGIFDGNSLAIKLDSDGKITKSKSGSTATNADFVNIAKTGGY